MAGGKTRRTKEEDERVTRKRREKEEEEAICKALRGNLTRKGGRGGSSVREKGIKRDARLAYAEKQS